MRVPAAVKLCDLLLQDIDSSILIAVCNLFQFSRFVSQGEPDALRGVLLSGLAWSTGQGKVFSWFHGFYTHSLKLTHFMFRTEFDTIFKPGEAGDQWAKVHAVYIFLIAVVSILTSTKNLYSSLPASSFFSFVLPFQENGGGKKNLFTTTQQCLI